MMAVGGVALVSTHNDVMMMASARYMQIVGVAADVDGHLWGADRHILDTAFDIYMFCNANQMGHRLGLNELEI